MDFYSYVIDLRYKVELKGSFIWKKGKILLQFNIEDLF